jgi:hypothetical protein
MSRQNKRMATRLKAYMPGFGGSKTMAKTGFMLDTGNLQTGRRSRLPAISLRATPLKE